MAVLADQRELMFSELFTALWADPFDDEHRLVVADALQQISDPQGELAMIQHRGGHPERERELITGLVGTVAEPLDLPSRTQLIGLTWHLGWIRRVRVQLDFRDLPAFDTIEQDLADATAALFATRAATLVEHLELRVGLWHRAVMFEDYLVILFGRGPYPALRVLEIGGFIAQDERVGSYPDRDLSAVYITNTTWPDGQARICAVMAMCPRLEEVRLQGNVANLGTIDLPRLRVFELCTSSLGSAALASLAAAKWPALERLVLWFGDCEYGGGPPCTAEQLAQFVIELEPKCRQLRHLAIANTACSDELVARLVGSPPRELFARLVGLDLSLGTLTTASVPALIELRSALPALVVLDVRQNYLAPADLRLLEAAYLGCEVRITGQRLDRHDGRYPAVGE